MVWKQLQVLLTTAASETEKVYYSVGWDEIDRLCGPIACEKKMKWGTTPQRPWKKDARKESVAQVLTKLSFEDERNATRDCTNSTSDTTVEKEIVVENALRVDLKNEPTVKRLMETLDRFTQDNDSDVESSESAPVEEATIADQQVLFADDQEFTKERLRLQSLAKEALEERARRMNEKTRHLSAAELFELEIQRAEEEEARRQQELELMSPAERELAEGKRRAAEAIARLKSDQQALQYQRELDELHGETEHLSAATDSFDEVEVDEPYDSSYIGRGGSLEVVDEIMDSFDESAEDHWDALTEERNVEERIHDEERVTEDISYKERKETLYEVESLNRETASTSDETEEKEEIIEEHAVSVGEHVGLVDQSIVNSPLTMKGALSPSSSRLLARPGLPSLNMPTSPVTRHLSFDQISCGGSDTVSNFSTDSGTGNTRKRVSDLIRRDLVNRDPSIIEAALVTMAEKALEASDRNTIARSGGILAIVQTMERHTEKAGIQIAACQALERLALDTENELAIGEVKGVEAILGAMMAHFTNSQVQEAAWSALCNCACGNACETMTIDTQGGMAALVSCMKQHVDNPKVVASAMNTFTNLCLNNDVRMNALAVSDGFGAMATALQRHWMSPLIRNEASHAMHTLLHQNAKSHSKMIARGEEKHREEEEEVIEEDEESVEEYVIEEDEEEYEEEVI